MTIKKFFIVFLLQFLAFSALKVVFYRSFDYTSIFWEFLYWAATVIITVVLVRRLGVINFLEAMFVAGFWLVFDFLLDFFITWPLSGTMIYATLALWAGYLFMVLFVFFLHQKRHIHIRKEQAARHHH